MIVIHAHFDGKVIVPDEPVDLAIDRALVVRIESPAESARPADESALSWLAQNAVEDADAPNDLSHQHDHYLYGTPKKPQ